MRLGSLKECGLVALDHLVSAVRRPSVQLFILQPAVPLMLLLLSVSAFSQTPVSSQAGHTGQAITSLLGIGIGANIEEARAKLEQIGSGGGRDTRDGGRKEAWTLKETDFASLAFKSSEAGKIVWVSAFVRPGHEIPFAKLGNPAKAVTITPSQAIWNVTTPLGGYRVVVKGLDGKASVVYLLSLEPAPVR